MIKPFTCLCLLAAAGSLLYLYQEKHTSQMMDREVAGLIKQADQIRERTGLLRAEYAMLNDPQRLSQLAAQHLSLQPLAPGQFVKLADLSSRLPAPVAAAPQPAAMDDGPVAAATPPQPTPTSSPPLPAAPVTLPVNLAAATPAALAARAPAPAVVAAASPPRRVVKPHEDAVKVAAQPARPAYTPDSSALYAPVVPAFASEKAAPPVRQATIQHASAGLPDPAGYAPPFVGSVLGMAHTTLAPPVPVASMPVASATDLGAASGR